MQPNVMPEQDPFWGVPRTYYTTSWGRTQVPMFFYRVGTRMLHYLVDRSAAGAALEGTGLVPVSVRGDRALVSLILFNFRAVTIGPYDEMAITILCRPEALPPPRSPVTTLLFRKRGSRWGSLGLYVLEMPVTSPAARAAGREIWGFPKFLTRIPKRVDGDGFAFRVLHPERQEPMLSVEGRLGRGLRTRAFDGVAFTNYENAIWKTSTTVDGFYRVCRPRDVEVRVAHEDHRLARNVRALGLDRTAPFLAASADDYRTRLEAGCPVVAWPTPPLPYPHAAEAACAVPEPARYAAP